MARAQNTSPAPEANVGVGLRISQEGNDTVIRFDSTADHGVSASGKSVRVASSLGNVLLPNGVTIGVNAYRKV